MSASNNGRLGRNPFQKPASLQQELKAFDAETESQTADGSEMGTTAPRSALSRAAERLLVDLPAASFVLALKVALSAKEAFRRGRR